MDTVAQQYRRRAGEVEKLAETAISEDHRKAILKIAEQWRELADDRERQDMRFGGNPPSKSN
jgi:hypothetical protein